MTYSNTAKYLHRYDIRYKAKMNWISSFQNFNSFLAGSPNYVGNKLLIYNQVLKPVWTYGIQFWRCTCKSNMDIIQRFQNKALHLTTNCSHVNEEVSKLFTKSTTVRTLHRTFPQDLVPLIN